MDGPRHERRQHFRGKAASRPRDAGSLPRGRVARRGSTAETRNIGVGGAFIATPHASSRSARTLDGRAHAADDRSDVHAARGRALGRADATAAMGVQFVGVDVDVLLELNDYFSTPHASALTSVDSKILSAEAGTKPWNSSPDGSG